MDISSDELIGLINSIYPEAVHGVDFWCGHYVKTGSAERISPAWIVEWNYSEPLPTDEQLEAAYVASQAGETESPQ